MIAHVKVHTMAHETARGMQSETWPEIAYEMLRWMVHEIVPARYDEMVPEMAHERYGVMEHAMAHEKCGGRKHAKVHGSGLSVP